MPSEDYDFVTQERKVSARLRRLSEAIVVLQENNYGDCADVVKAEWDRLKDHYEELLSAA